VPADREARTDDRARRCRWRRDVGWAEVDEEDLVLSGADDPGEVGDQLLALPGRQIAAEDGELEMLGRLLHHLQDRPQALEPDIAHVAIQMVRRA
jgi:hypothetical protein